MLCCSAYRHIVYMSTMQTTPTQKKSICVRARVSTSMRHTAIHQQPQHSHTTRSPNDERKTKTNGKKNQQFFHNQSNRCYAVPLAPPNIIWRCGEHYNKIRTNTTTVAWLLVNFLFGIERESQQNHNFECLRLILTMRRWWIPQLRI